MKLEVTYYSGDWSESDRGMVRGELESAGFEVTEGEGAVKGGVPPEALHLIVEAAHFAKDNAALLSVLLNSLIAIADRLYQRKGRASIRGGTPTRIYNVTVNIHIHADALRGIPANLADDDPARTGDMTWEDGRWQTVEQLHDREQ